MATAAVISALARSLLAGELDVEAARSRAARTLGQDWRWLGPLAERYVAAFTRDTRPRHRDVVQFLRKDRGFRRALKRFGAQIAVVNWIAEPQRMLPVASAAGWELPAVESTGDLAAWLSVSASELEWFADLKRLNRRAPKLQHYYYRILRKRAGGIRLAECPKARLKEMQRRILGEMLDRIPAHPAVHGFVKRRSIATFAAPHAGKRILLRLDSQDFFPSFPAARVQALFRTIGYPEGVAACLGGICSNAVPLTAWGTRPLEISPAEWLEARTLHSRFHLPQGAPTSPALANLMAYRLDCRLSGIAKSCGAAYTRYADDLAFSGEEAFARGMGRFTTHVEAIALEEGFHVNHKTRIMRQGMRQQIAGVVVNRTPSLRRHDLELLEAILTNCIR